VARITNLTLVLLPDDAVKEKTVTNAFFEKLCNCKSKGLRFSYSIYRKVKVVTYKGCKVTKGDSEA